MKKFKVKGAEVNDYLNSGKDGLGEFELSELVRYFGFENKAIEDIYDLERAIFEDSAGLESYEFEEVE